MFLQGVMSSSLANLHVGNNISPLAHFSLTSCTSPFSITLIFTLRHFWWYTFNLNTSSIKSNSSSNAIRIYFECDMAQWITQYWTAVWKCVWVADLVLACVANLSTNWNICEYKLPFIKQILLHNIMLKIIHCGKVDIFNV